MMRFEKKYGLTASLLSLLMLALGWLLHAYALQTRFKEPPLGRLPVSYTTNTSTGAFEAWYNYQPITASKKDVLKDAATRRKNLQRLVEETPYDDDASAVEASKVSETEAYTEYQVLIPTEKGFPAVGAALFVPKNISYPAPGILFLHGHFDDNQTLRDTTSAFPSNNHAVKHAEAGFITLALENRGTGYFRSHQGMSQMEYVNYELLQGRSYVPLAVKDAQKALAYLRGRPEVLPNRIAVAGVSLGGELAGFIGALDESVNAVVVSGYLNLYEGLIRGSAHDLFWYGITDMVGEVPQIVSLVAPRPLLIQQGASDKEMYGEPYRAHNADEAFKYVENIYAILNRSDLLKRVLFDGGHMYNNTSSIDFLSLHLLNWLQPN